MFNKNEFAEYIKVYSCNMPKSIKTTIFHPYLVKLTLHIESNKWIGIVELDGTPTFYRVFNAKDECIYQTKFNSFDKIIRNEYFWIKDLVFLNAKLSRNEPL